MAMELKGRITIYSVTGCPHCMKAKHTLQNLKLPYTDIDLESFPQSRHFVKQRTEKSKVPHIFFNNQYVGGNEELQKLVADKDELQKLIDEVSHNPVPADAPPLPDPATATHKVAAGDFKCEPDETAILVRDFKQSGSIHDRRVWLRMQRKVFTGKQLVDWLVKQKHIDRLNAVELGQAILDAHYAHDLQQGNNAVDFRDDVTLYRLLEDDQSNALNAGVTLECVLPVNELGEEIRRLILKIYSLFLSPDGKKVDYTGIRNSDDFARYKSLTSQLVRVRVAEASRQEKLAFFINVYNALVIHANIERGPPTNLWQRYQEKLAFFINVYNSLVIHANIERGPPANLWQRYQFFNTVCYIIGGESYSLQDIENGVLRANRKGVGMLFKPFSGSDPRLAVALDKPEPLIHFALVCGAKSCPPIKTYSAENIDDELKLAAQAFLETSEALQLVPEAREVKLSSIFKWYRVDFGDNDQQVLQFLCELMSEGGKKQRLRDLIGQDKVKLSHMTYDWSLNA